MKLTIVQARDIATQFQKLMNDGYDEQAYQKFLEENPYLIPREFIQNHGLHFDLIFRKLSLAKDYTTDFFYLSKSSADWFCILVEIEKPWSRYFKDGSNEFHPNFISALAQMNRWRAWFENSANKDGFVNGTIRPVRIPAGMTRNPCFFKYVLVHGRRSEFDGNEIRAGLIRGNERDDFKILSYDSLLEDLINKNDAYIAIRKNEIVEIISTRFVSDTIFSWVDPSYLAISDDLKKDVEKHKEHWQSLGLLNGGTLDNVLGRVKIISAE